MQQIICKPFGFSDSGFPSNYKVWTKNTHKLQSSPWRGQLCHQFVVPGRQRWNDDELMRFWWLSRCKPCPFPMVPVMAFNRPWSLSNCFSMANFKPIALRSHRYHWSPYDSFHQKHVQKSRCSFNMLSPAVVCAQHCKTWAQVSSRAAAVNASFTLGNTESILVLRPLFIK